MFGGMKLRVVSIFKMAHNFRIYGQNLYIFVGEKLVTLYRIPSELVKYCKF